MIREVDSKEDLKQFKWSTSDSEVVKVNQMGIITGKKNGCAVVTAVLKENKNVKTSCKVDVKKFEVRAIECKKSYTSSTEKYLNEKKTYRIIKSYDELKQFQKKTQKAYVKANGKQAKAKFQKSAFNKKLNRYKKSYFKSKTLCIIEDSQSSSSKKVKPGKVRLKQNAKGKIFLQLEVKVKSPGKQENMTTDMHYYQYFVEANSKDIKSIQGCNVKNVNLKR